MPISSLLPALNSHVRSHFLPPVAEGTQIPRLIHQTFHSKQLPPEFQENVDRLKTLNSNWEHKLYDDADVAHFIEEAYGPRILSYFHRINPRYGAARADLFRYLVMYKHGGVYLDIKSAFTRPIDEILQPDDRYLLAHWPNEAGQKHADWGMPRDLRHIPRGELQQWHIVCAPGHPFLKAVINTVLTNIDRYSPWLHGTGGPGVLRLTGPIAYTLAIHPLLRSHPHRLAKSHVDFSLTYSALTKMSHKPLFKSHYMTLTESVVQMNGVRKGSAKAYSFMKLTKRRLSALMYARR
jgi:hypothetical protein